MLFRSTAKPTALAAAFALAMSSAALGQTMVGDQEISEDDMPLVEEHCASLASADEMDAMEPGDTATEDADAGTEAMTPEAGTADAMTADAPPADGAATADAMETDTAADGADDDILDLASITAEDCEAAGISAQ